MSNILACAAVAVMAFTAPLPAVAGIENLGIFVLDDDIQIVARQGRGRGGDDRQDDDSRSRGSRGGSSDDDASGSGRSKPRVPGGSGCDDAGDIAEHASCRG